MLSDNIYMHYDKTSLQSDLTYKEFGKFAINTKLLCQNILLAKYKASYAPIPNLKRTNVSREFVDAINYIFDTNQIDYEKVRELSQKECDTFQMLIMKSGLYNTLKYDKSKTRDDLNDILEEYNILKGEIEADNNNPELLTKIKKIVKKLYNYGRISESDYRELMGENI
mmetsp:Transcript_4432/g.4444  ORF Transcript_4432/g.4444 Transcript_4432/m.4444 type:complete len:169 (+) Transcript_4432:623-1129(+)